MKEEYHKWYTPYLSRDFEMLVYGHAGLPVILFPTSQGRYYENKDFKMMEAAGWFLEQGLIKIYCPDSIDAQSWYNRGIHPADKVRTQEAYERVIINEVVKRAQVECSVHKVTFAGCSFGGYHAVNTAFRHPDITNYVMSMSGAYNMGSFLDGYFDENTYFNSPLAYLGGMQEGALLQQVRRMGIIIGLAEHDPCWHDNHEISKILNMKGVNHWFDMRPGTFHDWRVWRDQFPHYLSEMTKRG